MPENNLLTELLMRHRQSLLMELGITEDMLIELGRLSRRSVVPKHEREYNPPQEVTTYSQV